MKILNLSLKAKWFNMIAAGVKTEEYRAVKPYWIRRFCETTADPPACLCSSDSLCEKCFRGQIEGEFEQIQFDAVILHYGYTVLTLTFKVESVSVGRGKPEWGAPPDENVFIIKLGKRIS